MTIDNEPFVEKVTCHSDRIGSARVSALGT